MSELEAVAQEVVEAQAGMCVDGEQPYIRAELRRDMAIQRLREVLEEHNQTEVTS